MFSCQSKNSNMFDVTSSLKGLCEITEKPKHSLAAHSSEVFLCLFNFCMYLITSIVCKVINDS